MKFCPKCGSLLIPKEGKLECGCGYSETSTIKFREEIHPPKDIEVIDEATEHIGDTVIPIVCWNCGHRGVYFWMVQMRRADEPPTRFYKCRKCKKVWRSGK
ncbi:transcription factor S [Candidatus Woesearchaeota archaeon]|nr:transcription factor S [Candidatus Woesearchaeota archaeon]